MAIGGEIRRCHCLAKERQRQAVKQESKEVPLGRGEGARRVREVLLSRQENEPGRW